MHTFRHNNSVTNKFAGKSAELPALQPGLGDLPPGKRRRRKGFQKTSEEMGHQQQS